DDVGKAAAFERVVELRADDVLEAGQRVELAARHAVAQRRACAVQNHVDAATEAVALRTGVADGVDAAAAVQHVVAGAAVNDVVEVVAGDRVAADAAKNRFEILDLVQPDRGEPSDRVNVRQ